MSPQLWYDKVTLTGGYCTPEEVRDAFAGDRTRINDVIERMRTDRCPCCGLRDDGFTHIVTLECGHKMCDYWCDNQHHECIPCALAM